MVNSWSRAPLKDAILSGPSGNITSVPPEEAPRTTYIQGTGRFVGEPPARTPPASSGADGITLNLVNVPTSQAAKTVLGDIFALDYTVDPSVSGDVTIQTPEPVSKQRVMELFEAALRANNAALVQQGQIYKILPADRAISSGKIAVGAKEPASNGFGSSLRIIQLKYVSAEEMKRVLEPISPQGGIAQVDTARNTITLSGTKQDIEGMLEAVSIFDVDVMKGMSFAMVPIETSVPDTIADELRQVFATEEAGPMSGMVRFLPNKRLGAILVISPQAGYLRRAEEWIKRLDAQASGSEKRFFTYKVQNRQAQELVEVIRSMFSSEGAEAAAIRNVSPQARETSIRTASGSQNGSSQAGERFSDGFSSTNSAQTTASPSSDSGFGAAPESFSGSGDAPFRVVADPTKNAILIEATPKDYRRIRRLLDTLDVTPNQVLIEATIAEVTLTDDLRFGVRWYFKEQASSFTFSDAQTGALASVFPGFSYALAMSNVEATINALNEVTEVNIVSSPSLTVMDNKTAKLQIGDQVPITTQTSENLDNSDARIVNQVSYRDTGVILTITPRINERGRVLLEIEQEVSDVQETRTSGIDSPTISQRRVTTTVLVNDGQAIALGGLIQKSQNRGRTQIPILGDIPLVGTAFRSKDDQVDKTELIILIRPQVMRDLEEVQHVTDEFKLQFKERVLDARDKSRAAEKVFRRAFD
jgi:general secretion pathway protein D